MSLVEDLDGTRMAALKGLLHQLLLQLAPHIEAALVTGSLGYNWDHHVFKTSDLDLVVVAPVENIPLCLHMTTLATSAPHAGEAIELQRQGIVDLVSIKGCQKGLPFSVYFFTMEQFSRACQWGQFAMRVYRNEPKNSITRLVNFQGGALPHTITSRRLGRGYCFDMISSVIPKGIYYTGPLHGRFLHCPRIVMDRSGKIAGKLDGLWDIFLARMKQEQQHGPDPPDLRRLNPLNALKNAKYFSPRTRENVMAREYRG